MRLRIENGLLARIGSLFSTEAGREAGGIGFEIVGKWGKGGSFVVQDKASAALCRRFAGFSNHHAPFSPLPDNSSDQLHSTAESSPSFAYRLRSFGDARHVKRTILAGAGIAVATVSLVLLAIVLGLRVSLTDSAASAGIYQLISKAVVHKGELVGACLPSSIAELGLAHGYLHGGDCPAGAEPVAKIAGALPGDIVNIEPRGVAVNGSLYARSAVASHDSKGRPLPHVSWGTRKTGQGEVWLFGFNNLHSWDARYYGPIPLSNVRGELRPILTW